MPQEYWEEVITDKVEEELVTEEKMMNVVKSKYAFDGQGMVMAKGEVIICGSISLFKFKKMVRACGYGALYT